MLKEVRDFYFEDKKVGPKTTQEYIDMISDLNFIYPYYKSIKAHIQYSKGKAFAMRYVFLPCTACIQHYYMELMQIERLHHIC